MLSRKPTDVRIEHPVHLLAFPSYNKPILQSGLVLPPSPTIDSRRSSTLEDVEAIERS
jgi:hypothetical protein